VGNDKKETYTLAQAGAEPNTEDMVAKLSKYPLWQRLIPGSILWQPAHIETADVFYDTTQFTTFADARSKDLSFPPANARLAIKDGALVATAEVAGSDVNSDMVKQALSGAAIKIGQTTTIAIPSKRTAPERTAQDLAKVKTQAEAVIAHPVTITANGQQFTPSHADIASWVLLNTDAKGNVVLSIDETKVKTYLATINDKVGTPAGQTNINIVDGQESDRTTGTTGKAIDSDTLAHELNVQLLQSTQPIALTVTLVDVLPSVIFNHKYTTTQAGLQAYVTDVANAQDMHIVVQQLGGEKWYAAARETESIPSASTYKLFLSLVLFDRIDKGEIHWDDPWLDTDVAGCFDRMTVPSTNPCAEAWIAQFGRQYINDFVHARGFSDGTNFVVTDAIHTTAADLTKYMIGLNDGTLVSGANRDRLLNNLSRQPYKYGIPTGSSVPANQIYDKVGFLWDYVHDTAIVPHPRGTYILTIMSKGQGYAGVAAVARQIERIMYP
jgi:vancomycin resistance protein YoaR